MADIFTRLSRGDETEPAVFRNLGADDGTPQFETPSGLGDERTTPPTHSTWEDLGLDRYWANGAAADYDRDGRVTRFSRSGSKSYLRVSSRTKPTAVTASS